MHRRRFDARNIDIIIKSEKKNPLMLPDHQRHSESFTIESETSNDHFLYFNNNLEIKLDKAKSRDFYQLLTDKTHTGGHTGPKRQSENLVLIEGHWRKIKSLRSVCKETTLREFQFKFIHRTVVTQGELFKYWIKPDDKCCFCGEKDSIDHTFIHCFFTNSFVQKVTLWFNKTNNSQIYPTTEELLIGISIY